MPFLYPIKNIDTQEVEFKQLTNEIIIKNSISINEDETFKTFASKYLQKSFSYRFTNLEIDIFGFYNMRYGRDFNGTGFDENLMYL